MNDPVTMEFAPVSVAVPIEVPLEHDEEEVPQSNSVSVGFPVHVNTDA